MAAAARRRKRHQRASRNSTSPIITSQIAGQIPRGDGTNGTFNPDEWMEPKEQRKVDDFILFAMCAAKQALDDADWHPREYEDQIASGVLIGSGIGGVEGIAETAVTLRDRGPRRVSPFFIPGRHHQSRLRLCVDRPFAEGPQSRGGHGLFDRRSRHRRCRPADCARRCRRHGGGRHRSRRSIASRSPGFAACRALSTGFNDTPERASRPYDRDRDGFVMGEGAGAVVLEEYDHAKRRGARIYGELIGYGLSGDAYHITAPAEDGDGAFRCMKAALRRADIIAGGDRLHQCAWHLDAARRRDRAQGRRAAGRQCRRQHRACRRPNPRSAICSARPAPWRRFFVCLRCAIRSCRRRSISTTRRSRPRIDLVPHKARKRADQRGAVEFVRLRRHQRLARFPADAESCDQSPFCHICSALACDALRAPYRRGHRLKKSARRSQGIY